MGLRCDARYYRLFYEGHKKGGFQLSADDADCSVLAAFQLIQSRWSQPRLPGWGNIVDNNEVNGLQIFEYDSPNVVDVVIEA